MTFSSCFSNRLIFSRCCHMPNAEKKKTNTQTSWFCGLTAGYIRIISSGAIHKANIEPSETHPVIRIVTIQIPNNINAIFQLNTNKSPKVVPMPFPPLKKRNSEKLCPMMAEEEQSKASPLCPGNNCWAIRKGNMPLERSKRSEIIPNLNPSPRVILVAPMLPEPFSLTLVCLTASASQ